MVGLELEDDAEMHMAQAMEAMHFQPVSLESFKMAVLFVDEQLQTIWENVRQYRLDSSNFENECFDGVDPINDNVFEADSLLFLRKDLLKSSMDMILNQIKQMTRAIMFEQFPRNIASLEAVSLQVFESLERWKRDQQLAANGAQPTMSLGLIEQHFRALSQAWQAMWTQLHCVRTYAADGESDLLQPEVHGSLAAYKKRLEDFWPILLGKSFIVETQPPQVIKKSSRFKAHVRLLGTADEVSLNQRSISVQLITEQLARIIQSNEAATETQQRAIASGCQRITNGVEQWVVTRNAEGSSAIVNFVSMQIPDIRRDRGGDRRANNSVLDVKMALLFSGTVTTGKLDGGLQPAGGPPLAAPQQQLHAISLPVVVVVHHNQDAHAWATVTWDNQFAAPDREYFHVPSSKPWCEVARALNYKFASRTSTGSGKRFLSPAELNLLGNKFFGGTGWNENSPVALAQLSKGKPPVEKDRGASSTFWDWFYAVMVAVEHMKELWVAGLVMGFVSKQDAQQLLAPAAPGTFIVRFSDTQIGCVAIGYRNADDADPFTHLIFNSKDLQYKSLADRILGEDKLQVLFPNVVKSVFEKYCDTRAFAPEGYKTPA